MKNLVLVFTLILLCNHLYGQEKYGHATPQTADFMISGKYPVSLYTGKISISIPIYHIKDPDFDIPVSLSYNAEGFKPHKHPGVIGYNWGLNAGGCITREVANLPDEYKGSAAELFCDGFLIQTRKYTYNKDDVFNFSPNVGAINSNNVFAFNNVNMGDDYDYMPDVFSFNILGKSGQFMIGNDGQVKIISGDWVKVDLSGVPGFQATSRRYLRLDGDEISEIRITDTDGYTYFLGGSNDALEYTIIVDTDNSGFPRDNDSFEQLTPTVNAWHLTKVQAPNGRIVEFDYVQPIMGTAYFKNDPLWQFKYNRSAEGIVSKSAAKSVVLSKISIPDIDFELNFNNSYQNSKKLYNEFGDFSNPNYMLNSVTGQIDTIQLCNVTLGHIYKGGDSNWGYLFLTSIEYDANMKYNFSYNSSAITLDPKNLLKSSIDEFGYFKQNPFLGLLESIRHPTGGMSKFDFERHDFGTKRYYEYLTPVRVDPKIVYSVPTLVGGVRIRSVKNYINNQLEEETIYNYTSKFDLDVPLTTYDENGIASNLPEPYECIQSAPDNQLEVITTLCRDPASPQESGVYSTGIFNSNHILINFAYGNTVLIKGDNSDIYNVGEPYIGYSQVTEIIKNNSGNEEMYKTHTFTDYVNSKDISASNFSINDINVSILFRYQHAYSSASFIRGKTLSEIWRSSSKDIVYESHNKYSNIPAAGNDEFIIDVQQQLDSSLNYIVSLRSFGSFSIAKKIFYAPVLPTINTAYEIRNNNSIESKTEYEYDNQNRLKETRQLLSNGKYSFQEYSYPDEITAALTNSSDPFVNGYISLRDSYIIGKPIETVSGLINNGVKSYTSSTITLYNNLASPGLILAAPSKQYLLRINSPVSDYDHLSISNNTLSFDERMELKADFQFSNKLRLTSITYTGELSVVYTWDSKNLYPITESQGDFTTTYYYKPMVGLIRKIDARGVYTYYEYNDYLHRLTAIKDNHQNLIQHFEYNYQQD